MFRDFARLSCALLLALGVAAGAYAQEISLVREKIGATGAPHWREFLAAWDANVAP